MTSTLTKLQAKRAEQKQNGQEGFTLVELAIVLVIIGLIVGGVLVGQDLIRAAEIRATITDLESYNSAANTFRTKYNGYPGDLLSARAVQFGFVSGDGSNGAGDGDGVLENAITNPAGVGFETAGFWEHMSTAGYIKQGFNTMLQGNAANPVNALAALPADLTAATIPNVLPGMRSRETTYIHVYPSAGRNFYLLTAFNGNIAAASGLGTLQAGVSVTEALNIDEKLDDGQPTGGIVQAVAATTLDATPATGILGANAVDPGAAAAVGVCVNQGAGAPIVGDEIYNAINEDSLNSVACNLRIRTSF